VETKTMAFKEVYYLTDFSEASEKALWDAADFMLNAYKFWQA
jgi:hypothetical protein